MTHEERRRIIEAPILFRIVPGRSHAGKHIKRDVPTSGRRVRSVYLPENNDYDGTTYGFDEYFKQRER